MCLVIRLASNYQNHTSRTVRDSLTVKNTKDKSSSLGLVYTYWERVFAQQYEVYLKLWTIKGKITWCVDTDTISPSFVL